VSVRRLPLFPLPLVLFPRAPLPLHIFEPRYRRLLADCLTGDREFGIVCRPEGVEELEIPPGTAGCIARIEGAEELPDGRSNIVVVGLERFTLERILVDVAPYHVAEVSSLHDTPEAETTLSELADRLRALFLRVGSAARKIADDSAPLPELPPDPSSLSFAVAHHIDLKLTTKQQLLASRSAVERLRHLDELLSPVVESVEQRAVVHERARSNGHGPRALEI
jgi:ATP-dependent Lon protease